MPEFPTQIAFDVELMRPGCAIVQAMLGGDPRTCHHFDSDCWLVQPTPAMKVYPLRSEEELLALVERVKRRRALEVSDRRLGNG